MVRGDGPRLCGEITVADIGFPEDLTQSADLRIHLLEFLDAADALPARPPDGHKGFFGSLLVIAGGRGMSGAAYLTTATALRSGCGMVYAAFPARVVEALESRLVEAVKIPLPEGGGGHLTYESWETLEAALQKVDAVALGPGIGTHHDTVRLVDEIVCQDLPMIIDADGLNCLGGKAQYLTRRGAPTILTPHPGEMARLTGLPVAEIQKNRIEVAQQLAADARAVVVLKGAKTVVADPGGRAYINPTGNSGMAKGGSGDVLTGLIGGLLAQGCSALNAACAGVYLHGMAGDCARDVLGERGMTAQDIMGWMPRVLKRCDTRNLVGEV
jgi:NAD(P)H-hydrate epimerase